VHGKGVESSRFMRRRHPFWFPSAGALTLAGACAHAAPAPRVDEPRFPPHGTDATEPARPAARTSVTHDESVSPGWRVAGTVLDETSLQPLANRVIVVSPSLPGDTSVVIDGRQTTTDDRGQFVVSEVAPADDEGARAYDIAILEPDRTALSLYQHLSRPDPRLVHRARRNAGDLAVATTLSEPEPPRLLCSSPSATLSISDIELSWTPFHDGVHLLRLEADPSSRDPSIDVYTAATNVIVPPLGALGVAFPRMGATYQVHVDGLGPYRTIDRAVGPDGVGAPQRPRPVSSDPVTVEVRSAADARIAEAEVEARRGRAAAREAIKPPPCETPNGEWIWCGPPRRELCRSTMIECPPEGLREWYILPAMNRRLRFFPEFAKAAGMRCVRDCREARAFVRARSDYLKKHPDFENWPMESRDELGE
jgi:hypothetical protein